MLAEAWLRELLRSSSDPRRALHRRAPGAERAAIVDALRVRARTMLVRALEEAGLWQGTILGRRRFDLGAKAVALTDALCFLQPDDEALLFHANALLAARRYREASGEFDALSKASTHAPIRAYARLGLAVATSLAGERDSAATLCHRLVDSPLDGVARGAALSLFVQSARAGHRAGTRLALERCEELDGPAGLERAARILTNYATGCDAPRAGDIAATLLGAGARADWVGARWKELLTCC